MNLRRRTLRSALTMLGVIIGTTAIIVTISLGYGAEETQMAALEDMTNLRRIEVYPSGNWGRRTDDDNASGKRITKITDAVVASVRSIKNVYAVTPVVYFDFMGNFVLKAGKYENSSYNLVAVDPRDFFKIVKIKDGSPFSGSTSKAEIFLSDAMKAAFIDPKKDPDAYSDPYTMHWEMLDGGELKLPPIDFERTEMILQMKWELEDENKDYNDPDYEPTYETKDYQAKFMGTLDMDPQDETYYDFGYVPIVSIDWVKRLYRDNRAFFKDQQVSDERFKVFDRLIVLARTTDDVEQVFGDLREMGLEPISQIQMVNEYKKQIQTVQGFLGFIGGISMLVAALSIANTMMMSIYERTREIGVMKVLGCRLGNIRQMFLTEAAYIGVFGGLFGLLVSYSLSYAINNVEWLQTLIGSIMSSASLSSAIETRTSIIPYELALGTWGLVILVSIASGLYPAQRAMQLSSLAAIRNSD